MNHPKPEEWVSYVYGESPADSRRELAAHLQECGQCREEIETWKRSLKRLDAWKPATARRTRLEIPAPFLKWAAAAAFLLLAGILVGRATAPRLDAEKLRAQLAPEIKRELEGEMNQFVRDEVSRAASFTMASSRRYSDQVAQQVYVLLKNDVDTIAVNAAAGLRNTAQQLVQLADYQEPQDAITPAP